VCRQIGSQKAGVIKLTEMPNKVETLSPKTLHYKTQFQQKIAIVPRGFTESFLSFPQQPHERKLLSICLLVDTACCDPMCRALFNFETRKFNLWLGSILFNVQSRTVLKSSQIPVEYVRSIPMLM
jgi:hypothetical protein